MAMFTTYIAWSLITHHGFSFWPAFFITLVIAFVGGVALQRVVIRPLERASVLTVVMVTIALLVILNGLAALDLVAGDQVLPEPVPRDRSGRSAASHISMQDVGTIGVTIGCVLVLWLFFRFTKLGLAMRAGRAQPGRGAARSACASAWMLALGWGLAAVLGAVPG